MSKIKVLVSLAGGVTGRFLQSATSGSDSIEVVGAVKDIADVAAQARSSRAEVVVLDHDSLPADWVETITEVQRALKRPVGILLLSGLAPNAARSLPVDEYAVRLLATRASAATVIEAIRETAAAMAGERDDVAKRSRVEHQTAADAATAPAARPDSARTATESRSRALLTSQIAPLAALTAIFVPFVQWLYSGAFPMGTAWSSFIYYTRYVGRDMVLPFAAWNPNSYAGGPLSHQFPVAHSYAAALLGPALDPRGYLALAVFAFLALSYHLYFTISRRTLLSLSLAALTFWSSGTLSPLLSDGAGPLTASIFLFPLTLLLIFRFIDSGNAKLAVLAAFCCGLAFVGHPVVGAMTLIASFVTLAGVPLTTLRATCRMRWWLPAVYVLTALAVPAVFLYPLFTGDLPHLLVTGDQPVTFLDSLTAALAGGNPLVAILFIFAFRRIVNPRGRGGGALSAKSYLAVFVIASLLGAHLVFYVVGSGLSALLQPSNMRWALLVAFSCLICATPNFGRAGPELLSARAWLTPSLHLILPALLFAAAPVVYLAAGKPAQGADPSQGGAASAASTGSVAAGFIPPAVDLGSTTHRLFTADSALGRRWGLISPMPVVWAESESAEAGSWAKARDRALTGKSLDRDLSAAQAKNLASFYLDWYGIRYLSSPDSLAPTLSSVLTHYVNPKGLVFAAARSPSPIVEPTNAAVVLVVAGDSAYETILSDFALLHLHQRRLVPVRGPRVADLLTRERLSDFDGIIMYGYEYWYQSGTWSLLKQYVEEGGNLLIETSGDGQDSSGQDLPEPFPVGALQRGEASGNWNFKPSGNPLNESIDYRTLSTYSGDGAGAYAYASAGGVKPWAQVVLSVDDDPVIVAGRFGKGKVVWSGLDLPGRFRASHRTAAGDLLENLMQQTFERAAPPVGQYSVVRPKAEMLTVDGTGSRGVILKEQAADGWTGAVRSERGIEDAKVYRAGPDMMYVAIPAGLAGPVALDLRFTGGTIDWILLGVSIFAALLVLEYLALSGRLLLRPALRLLTFSPNISLGRGRRGAKVKQVSQ